MVIKSAELKNVVGVTTRKLPDTGLPEIAFAGRSNVGKSSLINALLQRKSLMFLFSAVNRTGRDEIMEKIDKYYRGGWS